MKKMLYLLIGALALNSCNNGNDDNTPDQSINGVWKLTNVRGGIAGTNDTFASGVINWTFNANGSIHVVNSNLDDTKTDLIDSGDYTYSFVPNPSTPQSCTEALIINGVSYGCYSINGNTLILNQVETDGYEVTLEKFDTTTFKGK
jgi:hypothetical protein